MNGKQSIFSMIGLIHKNELSEVLGYSGPNSSFHRWCSTMGIKHVPGRPGFYDPHLVRHRLNQSQGIAGATSIGGRERTEMTLVEQRRARNGK